MPSHTRMWRVWLCEYTGYEEKLQSNRANHWMCMHPLDLSGRPANVHVSTVVQYMHYPMSEEGRIHTKQKHYPITPAESTRVNLCKRQSLPLIRWAPCHEKQIRLERDRLHGVRRIRCQRRVGGLIIIGVAIIIIIHIILISTTTTTRACHSNDIPRATAKEGDDFPARSAK